MDISSRVVYCCHVHGVYDEYYYIGLTTILLPTLTEALLATQVPHVKGHFAFSHTTEVESNRGYGVLVVLASRQGMR